MRIKREPEPKGKGVIVSINRNFDINGIEDMLSLIRCAVLSNTAAEYKVKLEISEAEGNG